MINGLGVLGWGVGGIEAEAAMLGQPVSMLVPQVVGFRLHGRLPEGATATDLVLTVTQMLRRKGVVGKFVEFFGDGLDNLPLADRATIANMAPEYGATCGIFPVDAETIRYLELSGPARGLIRLVEAYCKEQGLFRTTGAPEAEYSDVLELDLSAVEPSLAGPKRPQDRVALSHAKEDWERALKQMIDATPKRPAQRVTATATATTDVKSELRLEGEGGGGTAVGRRGPDGPGRGLSPAARRLHQPRLGRHRGHHQLHQHVEPLGHGRRRAAGQKAVEKGLSTQPWVKASLAPGSKVVTDYLDDAGLTESLDALGFNTVGYGCTTCIGNSGPLSKEITQAIHDDDLVTVSVLSGNRTSRGGSTPRSGRTTWPRRRWSSPMPWPARSTST
jgi:aconitate hydratase